MSTPLRVLIVEDCDDDAALMLRELRRGGYAPVYERVYTAPAMSTVLDRQDWDLVLSDHSMPQFSAPEALSVLLQRRPNVPFLIVSGSIEESLAMALLGAGASGFVQKDNLSALALAVGRALREAEGRRT